MDGYKQHIKKYKRFDVFKIVEKNWNPKEKNYDDFVYYRATRWFTDTKNAVMLKRIFFSTIGVTIVFVIGGLYNIALPIYVFALFIGFLYFCGVMFGVDECEFESEDYDEVIENIDNCVKGD